MASPDIQPCPLVCHLTRKRAHLMNKAEHEAAVHERNVESCPWAPWKGTGQGSLSEGQNDSEVAAHKGILSPALWMQPFCL